MVKTDRDSDGDGRRGLFKRLYVSDSIFHESRLRHYLGFVILSFFTLLFSLSHFQFLTILRFLGSSLSEFIMRKKKKFFSSP